MIVCAVGQNEVQTGTVTSVFFHITLKFSYYATTSEPQ